MGSRQTQGLAAKEPPGRPPVVRQQATPVAGQSEVPYRMFLRESRVAPPVTMPHLEVGDTGNAASALASAFQSRSQFSRIESKFVPERAWRTRIHGSNL